MRLPSSSSLLLVASLASSSSLSALAAPTGDCPEDSSSPAPAPLNHDDTSIQSNSKSTSCSTATFASDIVTDNPQSRGLLDTVLTIPPLNVIVKPIIDDVYDGKKPPKARANLPIDHLPSFPLKGVLGDGRRAAPVEESGETHSPQDSSSPPDADADPDGSEHDPAAPSPPAPPSPPLKAPVGSLPVNVPAPALPGVPAGPRDASDFVAELRSPPPPRNPPNTPVQRGLPIQVPDIGLGGIFPPNSSN
jgi:hypothetical protein